VAPLFYLVSTLFICYPSAHASKGLWIVKRVAMSLAPMSGDTRATKCSDPYLDGAPGGGGGGSGGGLTGGGGGG
jgi:hypothetical protein